MQHTTASGTCNPSRFAFRTTREAITRSELSPNTEEVRHLKAELARVKRELKELKYATQQFVRSCI